MKLNEYGIFEYPKNPDSLDALVMNAEWSPHVSEQVRSISGGIRATPESTEYRVQQENDPQEMD